MSRRFEIVADGQSVRFYSPYNPDFVEEFKTAIPGTAKKPVYTGGKFDHWVVSGSHVDQLMELCKQHYGYAPDRVGVVSNPIETAHKLRLEYIGLPRERASGEVTATGWVNDGWNLVFPLVILEAWFNFKANKLIEEITYYEMLSLAPGATGAAVKKAYRKMARTYHPDLWRSASKQDQLDAAEAFIQGKQAYDILQDPMQRRKYDACLIETKNVAPGNSAKSANRIHWRPPVRCGDLEVMGIDVMGKITISKILKWEDVINTSGETMVTSWDVSIENFKTEWVR